jgi:hypothetical protein
MMKTFLICMLAATLAVLSTGCNRDGVKVYHVENSDTITPPPPAAAPAAMPLTMPGDLPAPDNSSQPQLKYILPDGWAEKTLTQMRVASFGISENGKNADISVIPLGGMAGGDFANVNRWRGQVGLPPLADDDLHALAQKTAVGDQPADLYDLTGGAQRILAVILHRDDTAWFFKMTGDADLVEAQKAAFISFLKSVQFGTPAAIPVTDMSQLPPSHPPVDEMNASSDEKPTWIIPPDWSETAPSQFLVAKFMIGSGDATAAVNVSSLAGDGGGLLANVNRWRGQLGLDPMANEIQPGSEGPAGQTIQTIGTLTVDYTGTDSRTGKPARLVGSIVPKNGQTWFYKLMGDPDLVAQQKDAFIKFVQSAKYPDAH